MTGERNLFYAPLRTDAVVRWSAGETSMNNFPTPWGPEDRYGDPRFVAPEKGDFHLRPDSPAIGRGIAREGSADLDGNPRGKGPSDLGCYGASPAPVLLKGDLDRNGRVNVGDAIMALRAAIGALVIDPEQTSAGDLDGDGAVRISDVIRILRIAIGLE